VNLTKTDRQELERWVAAQHTPQQVSQRCRIVLAAAQDQQDKLIADDLDLDFKTVALWRKRFIREGPDCLWEVAEGRGRKATLTPEDVEKIVDATLQTKPVGSTHWSCRTMAKAQGVSKATVNRIWQSYQIQPHRTKGFKLSRDVNRRETKPLQTDAGADQARLHPLQNPKNKGKITPVVCETLH
jgi:transposase